ncbi:MAG: flagellar assembly protein FliH [Candidatus Accumulibacter sp.]|jgi:flagellar assembly protein FliH|nr:flagellar assembly protein FliH [Accumulibacter sp.]
MTGIIPKEKLTAWQRWELAAFDEEKREAEEAAAAAAAAEAEKAAAAEAAAPGATPGETPADAIDGQTESAEPPTPGEEANEAAIALPTAAEIERLHDEAFQQGYSAGQAEGLAEASKTAERMAEILGGLEQAAAQVEQRVAEKLLDAAVGIAGQVLRQSLRVKPELLLPVVREALTALHLDTGEPSLILNPEDAQLIRAQMADQLAHGNWQLVEDPTITRGGCRIELGASEVDATVETRWKRVMETLGAKKDWLE